MLRPTRKSRSKPKATSIRLPDTNGDRPGASPATAPTAEKAAKLDATTESDFPALPGDSVRPEDSVLPEDSVHLKDQSLPDDLKPVTHCETNGESTQSMVTANATEVPWEADRTEVIERLEELLRRFDHLDIRLDEFAAPASRSPESSSLASSLLDSLAAEEVAAEESELDQQASPQAIADAEELSRLRQQLEEAWRENDTLRESNESLNAQLANSNAVNTVKASIGVDESLSWEDRKALIMAQMENDSFDANSFIESLSDKAQSSYESIGGGDGSADPGDGLLSGHLGGEQTPAEFVEALVQCVNRLEEEVRARDREIRDLNNLLQNQSEALHTDSHGGGVAVGAAAIAGLIDGDPLVMEERARLQQLKDDWEDKFRQSEIEASLERAKLSRERQELANRTRELEDRLDELQREKRTAGEGAVKGRRWLAELGLSPNDES